MWIALSTYMQLLSYLTLEMATRQKGTFCVQFPNEYYYLMICWSALKIYFNSQKHNLYL